MAPTPQRIAQTSTELKKQYKKNGSSVTERQQKQLERGHDLDLRASRAREAEQRRKAALQKRKEREEKEKAVRKQLGVGLATQMIGYSHTQAQLKNGMEAFLGVKQRKEEEKRRKELELTKKLELIAQEVEKEPWDDDDASDVVADLPEVPVDRKGSIDDGLDDEALIEAHDIVTSDPIEPPGEQAEKIEPIVISPEGPLPKMEAPKDDAEFTRLHGPVNRAVEKVLEQLPEQLIELLSQDISMKMPDWDPALGLLHKLNPLGLPPHRLRVKLGSIVVLLRDLNSSSQLSKSQHLRILRAENDRLECLVLDGQLEGTKALLTRVPFLAKYRNEDQYPFQRTQFPVRVAVDYKSAAPTRETSQSGFKMPAIPGRSTSSSLGTKAKARPRPSSVTSQCNANPGFKLPGLPASKVTTTTKAPPMTAVADLDCWEDFLGSGTQIARELSPDVVRKPVMKKQVHKPAIPALQRLTASVSLPPFSTQDLDFSMDELEVDSKPAVSKFAKPAISTAAQNDLLTTNKDDERPRSALRRVAIPSKASSAPPAPRRTGEKALSKIARHPPRREDSDNSTTLIDLANLRASQKPPSVSDRPGLKRKNWVTAPEKRLPPNKRHSLPPVADPTLARASVSVAASKATKSRTSDSTRNMFDEFMMSTQEAANFFDDDDDLSFGGSPPIAV